MLILDHCGFQVHHSRDMQINRPMGCVNYLFVRFYDPILIQQGDRMVQGPANSCILFRKFSPQLYYNDKQGYQHDFLHINGDELTDFIPKIGLPFDQLIPIHQVERIDAILEQIRYQMTRKHNFQPIENDTEKKIDVYLKMLFLELAKEGGASMPPAESIDLMDNLAKKYYTDFQNLRNEIYAGPGEKWTNQLMARKTFTGLSQFQHLYKKFFQISPTQDLIRSRIQYAQYLLQNTQESVAHISELCGYENDEHFIRQFKKIVGATPNKYRQEQVHHQLK